MDPVASKRGKQTARNMLLSTLVTAACAGVIYIFIPHDENADPIKAVDFSVELATVRTTAPYPVAAPEGLPEKWKATSVTYDRTAGKAWHLGFLDPDRRYVAVEQSITPAREYVPEVTHKAKDTGATEAVAGRTWQVWEGPKYNALVLQEKGHTTVVTGSAPKESLIEMAAALKTEAAAP
ncbi:hypothetical protein CIB93_14305 [Streptomyces sp. WZ.A104]|uniref:DUF4245 domain-containing protein n=1 Tax=Streptomyces durocortorensis TaxID=2811104 RepID=A0ABY9W2I4_9ACTN|nr:MULTISPECIES: DUF4245 domain-containing protein [Streptomyces]PCG85342.1 hypothetical protein CIB93_14305 [Streptomyces sp. WZ.A104]WNF29286.1 DUF4245 domain-containing protein [Streptomyces durocortorensis]